MSVLACVLLLSIGAGLWRILRGPSRADRLLAIQLFGTTGTALLLIMAHWQEQPELLDSALVLALLAAVVSAALVQYLRRAGHE
ncbi:multisubunit sodium/proton antiporter, MrpF subunit [Halopseudomonas xinjiangensis]|uniref:Multisubunit sodium/proton antiporter, MrpF subunit n=1 Tax=Halopseudomonas xinjiangensis TaxID=487184 RepID=A0A1H1YWL0_9GAMM|nr:monovalent cation/H+ antiporter complex subunit F [Halopseudomonas xinjiangensis]SDT25737.1 multisubunit sodium/proton antiporter, MrpF subunit [Halopseudomonas xinjiangensis]